MADAETLAALNAGLEAWNAFQERRITPGVGDAEGDRILDLTFAELENRDFSGWTFDRVDLSQAKLRDSRFNGALLSGVDLSQADLSAADLSKALLMIVDFTEAQLSGANLTQISSPMWVSFRNATLVGANLSLCRLEHAHFQFADLSESSFVDAQIEAGLFSGASLRDCDLSGANLSGANLEGTDLRGAVFDSTNLQNAAIYRTIPSAPDLSGALNIPSSEPKRSIAFGAAPGGGGGPLYSYPPDEESVAVRIKVLYVTDRVAGSGRHAYGTRRSENLSFGFADVSIPKFNRPIGELPRPSLWKLEFRENLARHVAILDVSEKTEESFYGMIRKSCVDSEVCSVLLFVHGYNVSFDDAVRRVAQLAYDLNFKGIPILYSWASQGTLRGYATDLANNEQTWSCLARFICDLRSRNDTCSIRLISHSMGGRAVCNASMLLFSECPRSEPMFENVIFAAPDVHVSSFAGVMPKLVKMARDVTLYFSPNDLALRASRTFHQTVRAGETAVVVEGLDTVDASLVPSDLLDHSVFVERTVLSDIFEIIERGTPPENRFALEPVDGSEGRYFRIRQ
jgi:esterase/lipase superfamily enzyme/uncharacterized protein YjbI with pentapeptide repeats